MENITTNCQVCQLTASKYTCPRCSIQTCSLACVKKHKEDTACSGVRDKTAYVPLKSYNEGNMMSDYVYLEEVSRQSDVLTRERLKANTTVKRKTQKVKSLERQIKELGILHRTLPAGMSRHKLNQTNYSNMSKQIYWTIDTHFCIDGRQERFLEHSFPGGKPFSAFFDNLLYVEKPLGKSDFAIIRHQLKVFAAAGLDQFVVALKREKSKEFVLCNLDSSLNEILKGEEVIEYPTVHIWLKGHEDDKVNFVEKDTSESESEESSSSDDDSSNSSSSSSDESDSNDNTDIDSRKENADSNNDISQ
ncbi:hypothetical protein K501DRAFT_249096 [Backusella circina FSU 941]|nr:hypothetical protein K501DRAFT_249096 [Backusella circina FSU 941]